VVGQSLHIPVVRWPTRVLHWQALTVAEQENLDEITIPGKYPEVEETILIWLYDHPGHDASTDTFNKMFNPDLKMYEASEELQEALETRNDSMCYRNPGRARSCCRE
jgi:hypothetical protein